MPWRLVLSVVLAIASAAVACGGHSASIGEGGGGSGGAGASSSSSGGGTPVGVDGGTLSGPNVAPVVVNSGLPGAPSFDVPFVTVTLCVPGTDTCETIDDVTVDTGSSGMRVLASALTGLRSFPQQVATTGDPLVECMQFDDGYTWGSVRLADVKIAGEVAGKIPIQVIGDPTYTNVPTDCSSSGPSENTLSTFGANGLIGINQIIPDCGDACADAADVLAGAYYSCTSSACTSVAVPVADQVPNPIASFGADGNGALLQFPAVAAGGAGALSGSLVFGIGTQANNGLGGAQVVTVDANGNFTTVYKGTTFDTSFLDSGTNLLAFNDSSIPACSSASGLSGYYCPTSLLSLTAQNTGRNGVTTTVSFRVESAETLFESSNAVFDDVAGSGVDAKSFDWGLPFFLGRSVYIALDGATTPGGAGPYFAY
jgi:hypothetical protein